MIEQITYQKVVTSVRIYVLEFCNDKLVKTYLSFILKKNDLYKDIIQAKILLYLLLDSVKNQYSYTFMC